MKSTVENLSPTRVRLAVEVPFDDLKPSLDSAYKAIAQQVRVPGFRPGKVPARVIDQRVGRGAVVQEAVNDALPKLYGEAAREHELQPLGQPEITDITSVDEITDGTDWHFTAEVDVRPEITLPELDGHRGHRRRRRGHRRRRRRAARRAPRPLRHPGRRRTSGRRG